MVFSDPLIEGFAWAKDGLRKSSCPWVSPDAIAAFRRGFDLAADFPTWADAKRFLILVAETQFDLDSLAAVRSARIDPYIIGAR